MKVWLSESIREYSCPNDDEVDGLGRVHMCIYDEYVNSRVSGGVWTSPDGSQWSKRVNTV